MPHRGLSGCLAQSLFFVSAMRLALLERVAGGVGLATAGFNRLHGTDLAQISLRTLGLTKKAPHTAGLYREGRRRRCIIPVDGFFEWKAIKGQKAKQPYAIAMKDGRPFGICGIWENWKEPDP